MRRTPDALALAAKTESSFSYPRYANWIAVCAYLLDRGYSAEEAEAILGSKWMRWAADQSLARYGKATSRDLDRWLYNEFGHRNREMAALKKMMAGER